MASIDENFVVKTGLTVGTTEISAASGNITVGSTVINGTTGDITIGATTINGTTGAITTTANINTTGTFTQNGTPVASSTTLAATTGSINGVTVGSTTRAAGAFTTLAATNNVTVGADIMPTANNVSNIGSATNRFQTIFVNEARLSTNTLYIGDTAILGTADDVINIHADSGQSISMQTQGAAGVMTFVSNAQVSMQTTGNNADVLIQSNGTGSKTRLLSSAAIELTAPTTTVVSNVTTTGTSILNGATTINGTTIVNGNLTVTGTTTAVNTTDLNVQDNVIILNSGETGVGVTASGGLSGVQFARGQVSSYQLVFRESDDSLAFGPVGSLTKVAVLNGSGVLVADVTGNLTGNASGSAATAGTVTTAAQPAITSVGTLTSLAVTGNVTANTFVGAHSGSGALLTSVPNGALTNSSVTVGSTSIALGATATTLAGLTSVSATTFTGALTGAASTAGTVTTAAQPAITSVGTLTSLTTSGDATIGGNLTVNGTTTTINAATLAVSDLNITVAKNAGTAAEANGAGLTVAGANATLTYGNTNDNFTFNKRVDATSFYGSGAGLSATSVPNSALQGSGAHTIGSTSIALGATATTLAGLTSVAATTFTGALTGAASTAATVTTAAQPAITSVGTLTSLAVTGNVTAANFVGAHVGSGALLTSIPNTALTNSSVTVTAGTGMSGGGAVSLGGSVTLTNAGVTQLTGGGGVSVSGSTGSVTLGSTATSANTASAIVARDVSGNFSAGTITASLTGTASASTTCGGFTPSATAGVANRIVVADASGYIFNTYINTTDHGISGSGSGVTSIMCKQGDNYLRATPAAGVSTFLGLTNSATTTATTSNTANQIVLRDGSGGFSAGVMTATATNARYADLAENYSADAEYTPGTVVEFGGDAEVTVAAADTRKVAGVVSTNPAYLMNSELSGTKAAVALQGRVPCRVVGKVAKGDMLVAAGAGAARAEADPKMGQVIGKALGSFDGVGEGVVEVVVGRM